MTMPATALPTILDTLTLELPVPLTLEERASFGDQLATLHGLEEDELAEQAQEKAAMKERLLSIANRRHKLAGLLRRGSENRPVKVEVVADYEAGVARGIRVDTGEVLTTRALRDEERQMPLSPEVAAAVDAAMVEHSQTTGPEA